MQSATKPRTIIVTGANKGIGYEIVKGLYSDQNSYSIILTSRNLELGQEAKNKIIESFPNSKNKIEVYQLEVNEPKSVEKFVTWIKDTIHKVDVLVNNAGYGYNKPSLEDSLLTLQTNYFSLVQLTEKLLPFLSEDGKIIQISSGAGNLKNQGEKIKEKLSDPNLTKESLTTIAEDLFENTKSRKVVDLGWNEQAYHNSKCLLNAYTRWVLPTLLKGNQQCYSCTPGYCRTDMTSPDATLSAEEGAQTAIFLVKLPFVKDEVFHTKFFRNNKCESYD